jgi:hypothetical protein
VGNLDEIVGYKGESNVGAILSKEPIKIPIFDVGVSRALAGASACPDPIPSPRGRGQGTPHCPGQTLRRGIAIQAPAGAH